MFKVKNKKVIYFTPCSNICFVNFEHVIAGWDILHGFQRCYITFLIPDKG